MTHLAIGVSGTLIRSACLGANVPLASLSHPFVRGQLHSFGTRTKRSDLRVYSMILPSSSEEISGVANT